MKYPVFVVDVSTEHGRRRWNASYVPAICDFYSLSAEEVDCLNLCNAKVSFAMQQGHGEFSESDFVIVDLTHVDERVAFLTGLALGSNRTAILLAQQGSEDRLASGRAVHRYEVESLRQVITRYLQYFSGSMNDSVVLREFLARLDIPAVILEGDGRYAYGTGKSGARVKIRMRDREYQFPSELAADFDAELTKSRVSAEAEGRLFFDGDLVRVFDWLPQRDERTGERGLVIDGMGTRYEQFRASHGFLSAGGERAQEARRREISLGTNLRDSWLANPLSVNLCAFIDGPGVEKLIVQRRNHLKTAHASYRLQCAAAGMVSRIRDHRSNEISPYDAAVNEIREELGVEVTPDDVDFLGLVREYSGFEVGLVGEVTFDAQTTRYRGPLTDRFEVEGLMLVEANPRALCDFMDRQPQEFRFSPLSAAAIALALVRRFPPEEVIGSLAGKLCSRAPEL